MVVLGLERQSVSTVAQQLLSHQRLKHHGLLPVPEEVSVVCARGIDQQVYSQCSRLLWSQLSTDSAGKGIKPRGHTAEAGGEREAYRSC